MRAINLNLVLGVTTGLAAATLVSGCRQEVESTDIRTSGVYPVIEVTADGSGSSHVDVRLKVGGRASNTFLELVGEDTLQATAGGVTKTLDSSGSVAYAARFPTETEGSFVIAFLRGPADESAPATTVNMPAPFSLTLGATAISRATGDLVVTWTPSPGSGNVTTTLSGACIHALVESTPDDGTATISRDRIRPTDNGADDGCTVTLTLTREQSGEVDPAFTEGGRVIARQVRAASFTSTP